MDIKWSYYLIIILYVIIFLLKYLNKHQHQIFRKTHENVGVYKVHKRDFFYTIAVMCTLITLFINGAALLAGKPLVISAFIITLLIIGMAYLTGRIELLTTENGLILIDGTTIQSDHVKEVVIKNKKAKTHYEILFQEPINGYEGITFDISGNKQSVFNEYIKGF